MNKGIYEKIKEKLYPMDVEYDYIRMVDPVNKEQITLKYKDIEGIEGTCYNYWIKGEACTNCISMEAYKNNDIFVKIEYKDDRVVLITALPVKINEIIYILEMFKDISQNQRILDFDNNMSITGVIDDMNKLIAKNQLGKADINSSDAKNRSWVTCADKIRFHDIDLLILKNKIEELRSVLNEVFLLPIEIVSYEEKLMISQYLDDLIVEYMKAL